MSCEHVTMSLEHVNMSWELLNMSIEPPCLSKETVNQILWTVNVS
jgi:hypothetical protein